MRQLGQPRTRRIHLPVNSVLLPLPLTPFERYYLADDCPEYPTAFPIELLFSGRMDRDTFLAAFTDTLDRHPLVSALVDESTRVPQWIAGGVNQRAVDWADESVTIAHPAGEYIDLRTSTGLRVWVRTAAGSTRALFEFHHACCDGLAALQFLAELLACYKIRAGGGATSPQLRDLDAEQLRHRGVYVGPERGKPSLGSALQDIWVTACVWSHILFRTPAILAAGGQLDDRGTTQRSKSDSAIDTSIRPGSVGPILPFESETLSVEESAALRRIAAPLGATINDLFLRDFVLALREWNKKHAGSAGGRLRLNVPVNVRQRDELRMPAANRIGFAFVTCNEGDCDDPRQVLAAVLKETRRIKEQQLALYFLGGLDFSTRIPGVVSWALGGNRSFATAVMSNVGHFRPETPPSPTEDRWSCGELVLESIAAVPPIRKLTRAAALVIEYAGKMTMCLRCDPRFFGREDTRALLNEYVKRVRQTLERGT